jgi:hypothetical protein
MKEKLNNACPQPTVPNVTHEFRLEDIAENYQPTTAFISEISVNESTAKEYDEEKVHLRTGDQADHIVVAEKDALDHWSSNTAAEIEQPER